MRAREIRKIFEEKGIPVLYYSFTGMSYGRKEIPEYAGSYNTVVYGELHKFYKGAEKGKTFIHEGREYEVVYEYYMSGDPYVPARYVWIAVPKEHTSLWNELAGA